MPPTPNDRAQEEIEIRTRSELATIKTVADTARLLRLTPRRVRVFITEGRLPAMRKGNQYLIHLSDILEFRKKPRKPGKPRKKQ